MSQPYLLGVNCWSRRKAMSWGRNFDPGGSLKPHTELIKAYAATQLQIQPIADYAWLQITSDKFYINPDREVPRVYQVYLAQKGIQ